MTKKKLCLSLNVYKESVELLQNPLARRRYWLVFIKKIL